MLSMKQQKFMLELLINKQLRPRDIIRKPLFCNNSDLFHQIKRLIDKKYVIRIKTGHDSVYELTIKGLLFTKILALNEPRYCSCLKKEYIEFILEPDGSA